MRDRTGVEDNIENYLGETGLRWLGHLERLDETNLIKRVREEKVGLSGHMKIGTLKKLWNEVEKEDMKKRDSGFSSIKKNSKEHPVNYFHKAMPRFWIGG